MAVKGGHSGSSSAVGVSIERKASLLATFLTNDPSKFSFAHLYPDVNSNRGIGTVLKLNQRRLAWGDKTSQRALALGQPLPLPYRSVALDLIRELFSESRNPDVLLCVLRAQTTQDHRQGQFSFEVVAFRLRSESDVRHFLELFASFTKVPDRSTHVTSRMATVDQRHHHHQRHHPPAPWDEEEEEEIYPASLPSTQGIRPSRGSVQVRTQKRSSTLPTAATPGATWSQHNKQPTKTNGTRRQKQNYNDYTGRSSRRTTTTTTMRYDDNDEQQRSVVFADNDDGSGSRRTVKHRGQDASTKMAAVAMEMPLRDHEFSTRAVASRSSVVRSDGETEDQMDMGSSSYSNRGYRRDRSSPRTLVDNGRVKVTVEEYHDALDPSTPDRVDSAFTNDRGHVAFHGRPGTSSVPALDRIDTEAFREEFFPSETGRRSSYRSRKVETSGRVRPISLESLDDPRLMRSSEMTSSVRKVFSRPSLRRSTSESSRKGHSPGDATATRRRHNEERPRTRHDHSYNQSESVYQSRATVRRQHSTANDIFNQSMPTIVQNQPINARTESVYRSRVNTSHNQPINARPDFSSQSRHSVAFRHQPMNAEHRTPESVAYQPRSITNRSHPISAVPENIYQWRSSTADHQPISVYQHRQTTTRRQSKKSEPPMIMRNEGGANSRHESRNEYDWRDPHPYPVSHSRGSTIIRVDHGTPRR